MLWMLFAVQSEIRNLTSEQYQEWMELNNEILQKLQQAVRLKFSPTDEEGKKIMKLHRRWLIIGNSKYNVQNHKGLARLYVVDQRFTAYYDRNISGCAQLLHDAIVYWA